MLDAKVVLKTVVQQFGSERVLDQIDLSIGQGEFVAIIGPSGCGKSTLLRLVAGLDAPSSGELQVDGVSPFEQRRSGSPQGDVSFVFQEPALLPWRSVLDNLALPLELLRRTRDEARLLSVLKEVGLSEADARKLPRMLSGGMKMRVSLARAWITDPSLLLMDEPFGALDDMLRVELADRLAALCASRQSTVLFVTHHVAEAVRLADRVLIMSRHPGRIAAEYRVPWGQDQRAGLISTPEFQTEVARVMQLLYSANSSDGETRS